MEKNVLNYLFEDMDWLASDTAYPHLHAIMSVHVPPANCLPLLLSMLLLLLFYILFYVS